ncbi:MAG: hypothetical protein LPK12_06090, partial [Rhodobacterales bacterium]|nr:hypothetical protein [Rhodobacterales bacterium]MDX5499549.1 hypothetical protein [Rhodobacterales bacterium]
PQPEPMPTPEPVMVPPYADPAPADIPPELGADDGDQTQSWPGEADADPMAAAKAALAASLTPAAVPEAAPAPKAPRPMMAPVAADDDLPPAPSSQILRAVTAARAEPGAPKLTDKVQKALGKASRSTKGKSKAPVQRPITAPPPPPLPPSASQPNVPQPKSEAEAMTVFGQRQQKIGGKPRFLGIALTGALLALLLVIAVWAAMFLDTPQDAAVTPETAAEAVATALPPAEPDAGAEATPDMTEPGTATTATAEPAPETLAATEEPEAVSAPDPAPAQAALSETAPDTSASASTATAPVRGLEGGRIDELTLPLPDQALGATPQARLAAPPGSSNADLPPSAPVVLPAYGALYQFDAQGNILPTPEGVITPDGVRLVAGRPAIIPPRSPFASAAEPAGPAAPETATATAPAAAAPGAIAILPTAPEAVSAFQPDAELSGSRRPRSRPAGLEPAAPTPAPAADEGALPAFDAADTRLASRRPPVRPAAIAAAATAAAAAEQTRRLAEAAAAAAAAASTAAAQTEATASLAPTRRPPVRPAGLTRSVETAVAAAVAQPRVAAPEPAVSRQSPSGRSRDGDIFDDGEPDTPQAAPSIPTRASVARQATVAGALNLGRTNLIGVFGTANNRYALVRESSGRLIKVKIGDRIDGGRVTAISASELSYQKGGNTVRLAMPRT